MRAHLLAMLAASAMLASAVTLAAEKPGRPANLNSGLHKQYSDTWRERAMKARAEFEPNGAPSQGTARASDERGERRDGEQSGGGRLREDRGEGGQE